MSTKIEIEKIKGGYILNHNHGESELISTTEELFENLLLIFEGKANCFHDTIYSKVMISREEPKK